MIAVQRRDTMSLPQWLIVDDSFQFESGVPIQAESVIYCSKPKPGMVLRAPLVQLEYREGDQLTLCEAEQLVLSVAYLDQWYPLPPDVPDLELELPEYYLAGNVYREIPGRYLLSIWSNEGSWCITNAYHYSMKNGKVEELSSLVDWVFPAPPAALSLTEDEVGLVEQIRPRMVLCDTWLATDSGYGVAYEDEAVILHYLLPTVKAAQNIGQ